MAGAADKSIGLTIYLLKPDQVQTFEHSVIDAAEEVVLVNEPLNGVSSLSLGKASSLNG